MDLIDKLTQYWYGLMRCFEPEFLHHKESDKADNNERIIFDKETFQPFYVVDYLENQYELKGTNERYKFLGWTQDKKAVIAANKNVAKLVNVPYVFSTSDMVFYACYVKESVYDSITDLKYFQWSSASVQTDPYDPNS